MTDTPRKIAGFVLHPALTPDRILEAAPRQMFGTDNPGFCVVCGSEHDGCEPDARRYPCGHCGQSAVYGAQELLLRIAP